MTEFWVRAFDVHSQEENLLKVSAIKRIEPHDDKSCTLHYGNRGQELLVAGSYADWVSWAGLWASNYIYAGPVEPPEPGCHD